jgi:1-acyl-sn-glycerol-3-phosphate acyltransferase
MLQMFMTIIFWPSFIITGALIQIILLARLLFIRDLQRRQNLAQYYRMLWCSWSLRLFFGVPSPRKLLEAAAALPAQFILVSNHRSNLDPIFVFVIGRPLVILSKRVVLKIPVIGWWMRLCGDVSVNRREKSSREDSLKAMRERLERGDSLLIFPEGTRQTDHVHLLGHFKDGAFNLAAQSGVPIVALVLNRTDQILEKDRFVINFRRLEYRISQPISSMGHSALELKEQCIQTMQAMSESMAHPKPSTK